MAKPTKPDNSSPLQSTVNSAVTVTNKLLHPNLMPGNRKGIKGLRIKRVSITRLEKASLTILNREIDCLLEKSYAGKLSKDDSVSLRDYIRTIRDLRKDEDVTLNRFSDEDLDKLANSVKKKADLV